MFSSTAARRTVAKCIQQLQIDGKITQVSVPLSGGIEKQSSENDMPSRKKEGPDIFKRGETTQLVLLNDAGTAEELVSAFLQRQSKEEDQRLQNLAEKTKVKAISSQSANTSSSSKKKMPRKRGSRIKPLAAPPASSLLESESDKSNSSYSDSSRESSEDEGILPSTGGTVGGLVREPRFRIAARDAVAARARTKLPAASLVSATIANNSSLSSDADDSDSGSDESFVLAAVKATATGAVRGSVRVRAATAASGTAKRKSRARIKPPAPQSDPSDERGRMLPSPPQDGDDGGIVPDAPHGFDELLAASNQSRSSAKASSTGSTQKRKLPVELAFAHLLESFEAASNSSNPSGTGGPIPSSSQSCGGVISILPRFSGGADSGILPHNENAEEVAEEHRSVVIDSSSNSSSARKRKGVDIPLEEQQLPKKIVRNSTMVSSYFDVSESKLSCAPPLGLTVPEALAHARSTDAESSKDDAVTPQEAYLLCHMFSLDETFNCVQSATILCDEMTPLDSEETLPTDDYEEKSSRLPEEDAAAAAAAKDTNTTRQAVRCTVRFPVADVISAAAAEATSKAMGPCHSGHYGPNLNRVLCGMNATTPAVNGTSGSNRHRHHHNGPTKNSPNWLLTQVLGAGMSGVTMMELVQRQEESNSNQALIDIAQNLVRDGLISIAHTPIGQGYQQIQDQMTNVTINLATTRFLNPVYASISHKIGRFGGEEDDAPASSSWSGVGGSRVRPVGKKLQHHQLRCKVVLLLTQKPGCYLEQIHAIACTQLTLDQVIMLLGDMENDGLLFSRKCSMSVGIASPFECTDSKTASRNSISTGNIAFFLRF